MTERTGKFCFSIVSGLLIHHNTCDSIGISFNTCLWNYLILKIPWHEILNIHEYTEIFFTFLFQIFFIKIFNISTNEIISVEGWSSQGYYDIFLLYKKIANRGAWYLLNLGRCSLFWASLFFFPDFLFLLCMRKLHNI